MRKLASDRLTQEIRNVQRGKRVGLLLKRDIDNCLAVFNTINEFEGARILGAILAASTTQTHNDHQAAASWRSVVYRGPRTVVRFAGTRFAVGRSNAHWRTDLTSGLFLKLCIGKKNIGRLLEELGDQVVMESLAVLTCVNRHVTFNVRIAEHGNN